MSCWLKRWSHHGGDTFSCLYGACFNHLSFVTKFHNYDHQSAQKRNTIFSLNEMTADGRLLASSSKFPQKCPITIKLHKWEPPNAMYINVTAFSTYADVQMQEMMCYEMAVISWPPEVHVCFHCKGLYYFAYVIL